MLKNKTEIQESPICKAYLQELGFLECVEHGQEEDR